MQRALCRYLRFSCGKLKDRECPIITGEDVRKKQNNEQKEEFIPPKYTITDAFVWTSGLIFTYHLTHRRNEIFGTLSKNRDQNELVDKKSCPIGLSTIIVNSQPIASTAKQINSQRVVVGSSTPSSSKTTIDQAPFLKEDLFLPLKPKGKILFKSNNNNLKEDDEDEILFLTEETSSTLLSANNTSKSNARLTDNQKVSKNKVAVTTNANTSEIFVGDLYGIVGSFLFLKKDKNPPLDAFQLLEKGTELGSARTFYNMGVAYERLNEKKLAEEYFRKSSDLGHPLGSFNLGINYLRRGRLNDGLNLLKFSAKNGVKEAQTILNDISP